MPQNKDLKRLVRTRMSKTGESYTSARAHILEKPKSNGKLTAAVVPTPDTSKYAKLAGMRDDAIKAKTGCTWERWVFALDRHGAGEMSHRQIAELISTKYKVADWWTQMVTVGYERIKGRRALGQRLDGSYEASKSRTFSVPVSRLFGAWSDAKTRKRWLADAGIKVRSSTAPKSMRLGASEGGTVAVWFTAKGRSKSTVAVQHGKLPDRDTANRLKVYWGERLDALSEVLARQQ